MMRELNWNTLTRETVKDLEGQASYNYVNTTSFRSSPLIPLTSNEPVQLYGFDPHNTYRFYTRDAVNANTFIRQDTDIYYIKRVEKYPRHNVVYIEVVK